ncbi:MAG TPA: hypothetical protein VE778_01050 [Candidatus Bathyarchaeia archaeon]|nr:hypothetical protein [Candidatus Bathyarchaeia archaeon]
MRIKLDIYLTGKNLLTLVGAVAVFAETLIALLVPADHLGWLRWRAAVIIIGALGIAALIWQTFKQSREDHEREERERHRDEEIQRISSAFDRLAKGAPTPSALASDPPKLGAESSVDAVFDGELERVFIYPRIGIPYKMLQEIWQLSHHPEEPKVDCDILVAAYVVNVSGSVQYLRDLTASVEVGGERKTLERRSDFRLQLPPDESADVEYGFESGDNDEPIALKPLLPELPFELTPNKPPEGWIRFTLPNVAPAAIDSNTWQFAIVDSRGNRHFITKTSDKPKKGEIGFRRPR